MKTAEEWALSLALLMATLQQLDDEKMYDGLVEMIRQIQADAIAHAVKS